jgi:hypothetical protein
LRQGEILFHIRGGHAFRFLEPTRLIEVKSGPYLGREKDKVLLGTDGPTLSVCISESADDHPLDNGSAIRACPMRSREAK